MIYRLCNLPLSVADFKREFETIVRIAEINGFDKQLVERLVKKHSTKANKNLRSTLFSQTICMKKKEFKKVSFSYVPHITNKLSNAFKKEKMEIIYNSNKKLKNILGSTKDKTPIEEKSGIYQIKCSDCEAKYIGQTRRNIGTRFREHYNCIKTNQTNKSAVAAHALNPKDDNRTTHKIGNFKESVRLLKSTNDQRRLDVYEAFFISKTEELMNFDNGNVISPLFSLAEIT